VVSSATFNTVGFRPLSAHLYELTNINGNVSYSVTQVPHGCANLRTYHAKIIFSTVKNSGASCHVNTFDVSQL
jgi:hypothetical protein